VRGDWAGKCVDVNLLNGAWWVGVACRGGMVDYEMVVTNVRSLITHLLDAFFGFYYDG